MDTRNYRVPAVRCRRGRSAEVICKRENIGGGCTPTVQHDHGFVGARERYAGGHYARPRHDPGSSSGKIASSSFLRGSRNGGSLRPLPKSGSGSSIVKPGSSVAISKRTPPGSWK
jgi:hypothetical protein